MENIIIRDGLINMNFQKITKMLANSSWSPGIKIDEVRKGAVNSSLVVGIFYKDEEQIGYARVVSDKTRFAYIADVYIDENFRKKGLAQKLITYILNHEELSDVYQWLLFTKNAHGVYSKVGFNPHESPENYMEIRNDRPER